MLRSLLKQFPLFIWLLSAVSSVPNFCPDSGRRSWSLVQVCWFSPAAGREGHCFPRLRCSGSRLLYMERALRCVWFQFSGPPQKCGLGCACVLCLPGRSSSGRQELDRRTLPGSGAPSPLRGPSLSFRWCQSGACACV